MVNEKSSAVGVNIQEKATMIWNVADVLRGPFKPHEYGLVILPMTVVKRFHDCLLPTHDAVIEQYEKVKKLAVIDGFLTRASGYQFYNTSRFTFESLLADPDNIEANFRDYLAGFSGNVQDVLTKFDFDNIIRRTHAGRSVFHAGGAGRCQTGASAEYSTGRAAPVQGSPLQGAEQRGDGAND